MPSTKNKKRTLKSELDCMFQLPIRLIAIRNDRIVAKYPTPEDVKRLADGREFLSCRYVERVEEACGVAVAFMAE